MLNAAIGESHDKAEFVFMLGDDYSQATRDNAITALLETFKNSPVGDSLKQGLPIEYSGKTKYLRTGWETPNPVSILYCMYRWAEATGRYSFTLSQMQAMRESGDPQGMDPACVFGLTNEQFKNVLQEIALHLDKYLRVSFVADLDNISLDENITSMDIIDLANEM